MATSDLLEMTSEFVDAFTNHDLDAVIGYFHDDGVFVSTDGAETRGKDAIRAIYTDLFERLDRFEETDSFVDERTGKVLTEWKCFMNTRSGKIVWEGLDVLHWRDGKLTLKSTYAKTEKPLIESAEAA